MKASTLLLASLSSVLLASLSAGCADTIAQAYDCHSVCNTYKDCIDSNYDVGACVDRCENHASDDQAFADQADSCQQCVDDRACSENWPCLDNCIGVVP